jgi:hypothetical protein
MKSVDPTKEYTYTPEWAPEVTVYYCQPFGVTVPLDGKAGFFNLYLDNFIRRIDGLEIPEENMKLPWSKLLPPRLANEMFTKITELAHLEDTEKEG